MQTASLIAYIVMCLILAGIAFKRSLKTSSKSAKVVLLRLHLVNLVGVLGLAAPIATSWQPDPLCLLVLGAFLLSEILNEAFWRKAVPHPDAVTVPGDLGEAVAQVDMRRAA